MNIKSILFASKIQKELAILEASNSMEVFRVEHIKSGKGPYQTKLNDGSVFNLSDKFPVNPRENPDPAKDIKLRPFIKTGVFCFNSEAQMRKWFGTKALKYLVNEVKEFHIIKKIVPKDKVVCSEAQCIVNELAWKKANAKIIKF